MQMRYFYSAFASFFAVFLEDGGITSRISQDMNTSGDFIRFEDKGGEHI